MDTPPAPGRWSVRDILAHLGDCELVFAFRLRQTLEQPGTVITPFDQDVWAVRYSAYSSADALRTFVAVRDWNLALLTTVTRAEQANTVTHPERGGLTFQVLLGTIAGRDLNHLTRLRTAGVKHRYIVILSVAMSLIRLPARATEGFLVRKLRSALATKALAGSFALLRMTRWL